MTRPASVDEYLATLPEERRAVMEQLRRTISAAAPDATEQMSYQMPAFKTHGRFLVSYDALKDHYSLFPASEAVIEALGDELKPYLSGKGTIRFAPDAPLPLSLVTEVVRIRVAENAAAHEARAGAGRRT